MKIKWKLIFLVGFLGLMSPDQCFLSTSWAHKAFVVTPVGIKPTITHFRGASLFYTNFWNSKLILHKAITGLGSEWWPTTRPKALLPSVDNLHWYPFLIRARRHKALSWGNNGMTKICYCLTRMSSSSLGAFHNRRLPRTLSGIN